MADNEIDIAADVIQQLQASAAGQGTTVENIDLSGLRVRSDPPELDPPQTQTKQPRELWSQSYMNCTRQSRTQHISTSRTTSSTASVELSARLRFGRGMSSQNRVIETLMLGSNFSIEVDLAANTRYSRSQDVSRTIDEHTPVAPCTELRVAMIESGTISEIQIRIVVRVSGSVSCTFVSPDWWAGDVDITVPISRRYVITGTALVNGAHIDVTWNELRAQCPPGTPCGRLAHLSDEEFWNAMESGTSSAPGPSGATQPGTAPAPEQPSSGHAEGWAPYANQPSPQVIWNCGDEFIVVAEGTGRDDATAEQAAFAEAQRIARPQCPGVCPAQYVDTYRIVFSDAPGGGRRAKWYGYFKCVRKRE